MPAIDSDAARSLLDRVFAEAEQQVIGGLEPDVSEEIRSACDVIFESGTQAYREVLVGCAVARIQNRRINIRTPYIESGERAFSGRSLDEKVVNPFFHDHRIPSSRGPYLSVFRRSVQFDSATRKGLRDKPGYDSFLELLTILQSISKKGALIDFLRYLLFRFVQLREAATIPLSRLRRMSLEQYDDLISRLLASKSGGRFPVVLVVAAFKTINEFFDLEWDVSYQGINVADRASGAGGDITIASDRETLLAAEVTERPIDRSRVVATFNTKIAPQGIEDYLFFVKPGSLSSDARRQAHQYFSQGHEVNFLEIKNWIVMSLATMGKRGRSIFSTKLLELMSGGDFPASLKVVWNENIADILGT